MRNHIRRVEELLGKGQGSVVSTTQVIDLQGMVLKLEVSNEYVDQNTLRALRMSQPDEEKDLSVPSNQQGAMTPIQSIESMLQNSLQYISEDKKRQIMEKAAEESLRLTIKQTEQALDDQAADKLVNKAMQVATLNAQVPGNEVEFRGSVDSAHGKTEVQVKRPDGFCFVATACFGDYDHPTVCDLRSFRDRFLAKNCIGRSSLHCTTHMGAHWLES